MPPRRVRIAGKLPIVRLPPIGTAGPVVEPVARGIDRGHRKRLGRPCHIEGTPTSADGRQHVVVRCKARSPASRHWPPHARWR